MVPDTKTSAQLAGWNKIVMNDFQVHTPGAFAFQQVSNPGLGKAAFFNVTVLSEN